MLSIIPDFLNPNTHYSFSIKPCYYSLFSFHPQTSDIINYWATDYPLITHWLLTNWFHWCDRLVSSRVSSGKRRLLCGRPAKLTGMADRVALNGYWKKEIGPHLLTLRFENKEKRRKVTKCGPNIFWFLLSCFCRFRCLCSRLLPFRHMFCW